MTDSTYDLGREQMQAWTSLVGEIERFWDEIRDLPVSPGVTAAEIRSELGRRFTFDKPIPLESLTTDICSLLRSWSVHVTHPRYFGLFNPSVRPAGIVADTIVALFNPQLAVWSHAPVANEIEQLTLRLFADLIGRARPRRAAGHLPHHGEPPFFCQNRTYDRLGHRLPERNPHGRRSWTPRRGAGATDQS